jgi:hypothetical protein
MPRQAAPAALLWLLTLPMAGSAAAQEVPGRDLLHFPLGTMERPSALRGGIGDGLANPASIVLDSGVRAFVGAAALQTPADQGVAAQLLAASMALPQRITVGLSIAHFAVDDIFRTETDPTTFGEVAYGTTVYSATVAQRHNALVASGIALRYRHGQAERESRGAIGLDAGVLLDGLPYRDASVGVASFMWRPANAELERTSLNLAGDLRLLGASEVREMRVGYGITLTEGYGSEEVGVASVRLRVWDVRAGMARTRIHGRVNWRPRVAAGVRLAGYRVSVARESNGAGLEAIYQFVLGARVR